MEEDLPVFTFSSTEKQLELFLTQYNDHKIVIPPDEPLQKFTKRNKRICRFCNSAAGEKKFKKEAHVIPEFMGNKYLQSDFECDDCNSHFSKYETNLAGWLGMIRTIMGTKGKNGVPTFKSPKDEIIARAIDFYNNKATKISSSNLDNDAIKIDKDSGRTVITYSKESYTPIFFYKSLLKIALSLIGEDEVEQYQFAIKYLRSDSPNMWCDEFAKVVLHTLPMKHRFPKPLSIIYKKKCTESKLPMHVFVLYFETSIFAFPLPFNKLDCDNGLYDDHKMNFIMPPAILFTKPQQNDQCLSRYLDLFNYEKIVGEKAEVSFYVNPNDLKDNVIIDPKTGFSTRGSLDEKSVTSVVIAPIGSKIKIDQSKP